MLYFFLLRDRGRHDELQIRQDGETFMRDVLAEIKEGKETVWVNPRLRPFEEVKDRLPLTSEDIDDAEARLKSFAPFIEKRFPETASMHGIIESPLTEIPRMKELISCKR